MNLLSQMKLNLGSLVLILDETDGRVRLGGLHRQKVGWGGMGNDKNDYYRRSTD